QPALAVPDPAPPDPSDLAPPRGSFAPPARALPEASRCPPAIPPRSGCAGGRPLLILTIQALRGSCPIVRRFPDPPHYPKPSAICLAPGFTPMTPRGRSTAPPRKSPLRRKPRRAYSFFNAPPIRAWRGHLVGV